MINVRNHSELLRQIYMNKAALLLLFALGTIITYPVKMALHFDYGYFAAARSVLHNIATIGTLAFFAATTGGVVPFSPILLIILVTFLCLTVYHQLQTNRNIREGHIIISSIGGLHSWLFPAFRKLWRKFRSQIPAPVRHWIPIPDEVSYQTWFETAGIFLIGLLVYPLDQWAGIYLVVAAIALCLQSAIGQGLAQIALWTALDAQIEAEWMHQVVQYMRNPKERDEDDDEDPVMRGNIFGRAMPAILRNNKAADLLDRARQQTEPSPFEVGVRGQAVNGSGQLPLSMPGGQDSGEAPDTS